MRNLIKEHKIDFRGPLTRSQWPRRYHELFLAVRTAGSTEFDQYRPDEKTPREVVHEMKRRAFDLTRVATKDRQGRVNEPTLRGNTEHHVFERFDAEVKWCGCLSVWCRQRKALPLTLFSRTCRNYLWRSKFEALSRDPVEADALGRRRKERFLCQCPPQSPSYDDL